MRPGIGLFDIVPPDVMQFGQGGAFVPKKVPDLLDLKKEDVSRLSGVAVSSVRYDDAIPTPMRDRLEEVANTINMVASMFSGDVNKTAAWFCFPVIHHDPLSFVHKIKNLTICWHVIGTMQQHCSRTVADSLRATL